MAQPILRGQPVYGAGYSSSSEEVASTTIFGVIYAIHVQAITYIQRVLHQAFPLPF